MATKTPEPRLPSLGLALTPVVLTLFILGLQLFYLDDFTPHIPLAIGLAITGVVGMIIGVWIASGTVPTLIHYGLTILSPQIFLAAAMILGSVVSLSLGTSWGTVGTVGLALMGIGAGFGIPVCWTAGAVVSGAFFGDRISPLSDTTNRAAAVRRRRSERLFADQLQEARGLAQHRQQIPDVIEHPARGVQQQRARRAVADAEADYLERSARDEALRLVHGHAELHSPLSGMRGIARAGTRARPGRAG